MNRIETLQALRAEASKRILVLDGAMGTMIQQHRFTEQQFRGARFADWPQDLRGNNDLLILTQPDAIRAIHLAYAEAGADLVATNTFSSTTIAQADYGMERLVPELNFEGAKLVREACDIATAKDGRPRFVVGALGPTNRTASISPDVNNPGFRAVGFDELGRAYAEATRALIEGGADLLLIETIFDTLNAKAAYVGIESVFAEFGERLPVMVSGTITDLSGRTLSGQTPTAFWTSMSHVQPFSIGLNCALGAREMRAHLAEISRVADTFVCAYPNAGLPNEFGLYDESPEYMAGLVGEFADSGLVNILGGCCGTTPAHVHAIAKRIDGIKPRVVPEIEPRLRLSGLEPFVLDEAIRFVNVGERTNVTGSARFRKLVKEGDYAKAARRRTRSGRGRSADHRHQHGRRTARFREGDGRVPEPRRGRARHRPRADHGRFSKFSVIEAGLKCVQGKAIVNSISMKEGIDKFIADARTVRRYGAAVVVMAFDEQGQADTQARKVEICSRAYKILTEEVGVPPQDIIFDPNIFAVATGIEEHDNYGVDFIEGDARDPRENAARAYFRRRLEPVVLVPRQRAGARGDALGVSLPCHPPPAWTWASSTPASSPSMRTSSPSCARPARTSSSTVARIRRSVCWRSPSASRGRAPSARARTSPGASFPSPSVSNTRSSTASPNSSTSTRRRRARRPSARST